MKLTNILRCKKNIPKVYVLMRLYCPDVFQSDDFLDGLKGALMSVKRNRDRYRGDLVLLINDDTSHKQFDAYMNYAKDRNAMLINLIGEEGKCWIQTNSPGGEGSACAMLRLRRLFVSLSADDNDIAITLDQDDRLRNGAVRNIARRIKPQGIVVTSFVEKGDVGLDILGDKGKSHRRLVRHLVCPIYARCLMKGKTKKSIADLDSIGWTKSYTRYVMRQYLDDFDLAMANRGGAEAFFTTNKAYEDFLDFYVLLLKDIKIDVVWSRTHVYFKNKKSITAQPTVDDFRYYRTAMLVALVDLCKTCKSSLRDDYMPLLQRFVTTKASKIEGILDDYKKKNLYPELTTKIYRRFFVNNLCRLAMGGPMEEKERFIFESSRCSDSRSNFYELIECGECQRNEDSMAAEMQVVCGKLECREKEDADKVILNLMGSYDIPRQVQHKNINRWIVRTWIFLGLFLFCVLLLLLFKIQNIPNFVENYSVIITGLFTVFTAVFTFLYTERSKLALLMDNEIATVKLYYSEFLDFIRHLEANIKVMLQIRDDLSNGKSKVEDIHLGNLKWPETSSLFSQEIAKLIDRNRVDDFARLMVNMRNVNNSAVWLRRKAMAGGNLRASLDWEIMRHIGYLVNLYYMRDNDFQFAEQFQLENYINENQIKAKLSSLFMCYDDVQSRLEGVDYFLNRYYNDRRIRRDVLVD